MHDAMRQAAEGPIVILGVTPDRSESGYGYIQALTVLSSTLLVDRVVEKSDETTPWQYRAEGGYYWDAGMSVLNASVWLQVMREDILLNGALELTNEHYAIAKSAGSSSENCGHQCSQSQGGRSVMPTDLGGSGDNYHPGSSHVIPALICRFHDAKVNRASKVTIWGTGSLRRDSSTWPPLACTSSTSRGPSTSNTPRSCSASFMWATGKT